MSGAEATKSMTLSVRLLRQNRAVENALREDHELNEVDAEVGRLPYPTANEAVGFFRDNWNWIKDRVQDRIDDGQFIDGEVAI
jgi:hypothetical protein